MFVCRDPNLSSKFPATSGTRTPLSVLTFGVPNGLRDTVSPGIQVDHLRVSEASASISLKQFASDRGRVIGRVALAGDRDIGGRVGSDMVRIRGGRRSGLLSFVLPLRVALCAMVVLGGVLASGVWAQAPDVPPALLVHESRTDTPLLDRGVIRSTAVTMDISTLSAKRDQFLFGPLTTQKIVLRAFDSESLDLVLTRMEIVGDFNAFHGTVDGIPYSSVTLVEREGVVAGNINAVGKSYQIRYRGPEIGHQLREIDTAQFRSHGDDSMVRPPRLVDSSQHAPPPLAVDALHDDGSTIDVLIAYTPAARIAAGGLAALTSEITLAVSEANGAYANSGVIQRLRLVSTIEVNYTVSAKLLDDLYRITENTDGVMNPVFTRRNQVGADIVSVWVDSPDATSCGWAWIMDNVRASFEDSAINVLPWECATVNYTFAHELGHNMGLRHDLFVDNAAEQGATPSYPYAHGYVDPAKRWHTVMAYPNQCGYYCPAIQYFSNPSVNFQGGTTGNASYANAALALNNTRNTVANFRASNTNAAPVITRHPSSVSANAGQTVSFTAAATGSPAPTVKWQALVNGGATIIDIAGATSMTYTLTAEQSQNGHMFRAVFTNVAGSATTNPATLNMSVTPASIITPAPGTQLAGATQTFTWSNVGAGNYQVYVGNTVGASDIGAFPSGGTSTNSTVVAGLPTDGRTLYVRLYTFFAGQPYSRDYTYTAFQSSVTPATMVSPAEGSVLASASQTFTWGNAGAGNYQVYVGSSLGSSDLGAFPSGGTAGTSTVVTGLPTDGRTLHVRLYSFFSGQPYWRDYTYKAFLSQPVVAPASMTSPAAGVTLSSATQTFGWTNAGAGMYQIYVGNAVGASDLGAFPSGGTALTSTVVSGLPTDSRTLYVRLYSFFGGQPYWRDYTYKAAPPSIVPASMISPADGSTLASSQTFTWTNAGAGNYQIYVGNAIGASDIGAFPSGGTASTTTAITGLPTDGRTLYVRLYSFFAGQPYWRDYSYKAAPPLTPASMTGPAPGITLGGATQTFTWTNAGAGLYQIYVGSSLGAGDIGAFPPAGTASTSTTIFGLPTDSRTLYVRLYSFFAGQPYSRDYTYQAAPPPISPANMASPADGSTLTGPTQVFTWNNAGAGAYQIYVGNAVGASDLGAFPSGGTASNSTVVAGLPMDGRTLYVRLYSFFGGQPYWRDYAYKAAPPPIQAPTMISPADGSQLSSPTQTFTWTNTGAPLYQIYVGSSVGGGDIGAFPSGGNASTSTVVSGLPADGRNVYVRLYSFVAGMPYARDYVYRAAPPPTPATMTSPGAGATLSGATQTFSWTNAGAGIYQLYVGNSVGAGDIGAFPSGGTASTSTVVSGLPNDGRTIYVRLYSFFNGQPYYRDYTYLAVPPPTPASMMSPTGGSTLAGATHTFTWTNAGADIYQLYIGSSVGAADIGAFPPAGTASTSTVVAGLPVDGRTIYVRLYSLFAGQPYWRDYTFKAIKPPEAVFTFPANGSTMSGGIQTFTWNDAGAGSYQIYIGNSVGAADIGAYPPGGTAANAAIISGLPTDGRTLYVRLYSFFSGTPFWRDYVFQAFSDPAIMTSPADNSVLPGSTHTFTWTDVHASLYFVYVGNSVGANDLGTYPASGTTATSTVISGLPTDGRRLYVRLYSAIGGNWYYRDYTYVAAGGPTIISPTNGISLASASPTFSWTSAGATHYQLYVGSTPGGADIGVYPAGGSTTATSIAIASLPTDGRMIYVRLHYEINGNWNFNDNVYWAPGTTQPATMLSPVAGSQFAESTQTFTWTNVGATAHYVYVGNSAGLYDLGIYPALGTTDRSTTIAGLPTDGRTLYVRLYSAIGGAWYWRDYVYSAAAGPATLLSPANGSLLSGQTHTFTWTDSGADNYQVWVSDMPGTHTYGYYPMAGTTATSTQITALPTDGRIIHVRLFSQIGPAWYWNDYSFVTGP